MGIWQHTYLFPQSPVPLDATDAIHCWSHSGFSIDPSIHLCVPIDQEGHWMDAGNKIVLSQPPLADLIEYLHQRVPFSMTLGGEYFTATVCFQFLAKNPHIVLSWPYNLFLNSPPDYQKRFLDSVHIFSSKCNAAYILSGVEINDDIEDLFVESGNKRIFNLSKGSCGVSSISVKTSLISSLPEGPLYGISEDIGEGYSRYPFGVKRRPVP